MNNDELLKIMDNEFEDIKALFAKKNESYGANQDTFYNFRQTATRMYPATNNELTTTIYDKMFAVAETLVDKHNVALAKGIHVNECRERLRDRIVYSLIEIAMIDEMIEQWKQFEEVEV